jgi:hypothetical protein
VRGLSQRQLSGPAGVRQAAISHLESGRARRIDLDVLDRLCWALHGDDAHRHVIRAEDQRERRRYMKTVHCG